MLRIKGASKEDASEEARKVFEEQEKQYGSILNTAKVYGLRPSIQKASRRCKPAFSNRA